jgi:hypothetical protein
MGRHMSFFGAQKLYLHLLCESDTPLHQLGYQPGRFLLVVFLEGVTILR